MKVHHNEYSTKSVKLLKKLNLNKKEEISNKNNSDLSFPKIKYIKNLKKNINDKFSSIRNEKNIKKSYDSKNFLKTNYIINNQKTIIPQNNRSSRKRIGLIHKSNILHQQKNNSKNKINIKNYNSIDNNHNKNNNNNKNIINNPKNNINSVKYNSNDHRHININPNINVNANKSLNKSLNNISNKNQESKLINNISVSNGLNMPSKENKKYINFNDSENNNYKHNYNKDSQSVEKNNIFIEENKENINNFCYETGTKEDSNENKIILKCDNNSLLTFGNSFSYSNSQKSKSTKKFFNNDNNNKDKDKDIININNKDKNKNSCFNLIGQYNLNNNYNYVNKLKEENETLRKELKESNDQITFLMSQIRELKEGKNYKPSKILRKKVCPPNIWNKKPMNIDDNEKENYNSCNTLENKIYGQVNNKKNIIKHINENNNINNNNNGNKLKVNKIKINKKIFIGNKKYQKKNNANLIYLDKPCEKINECISKIKI